MNRAYLLIPGGNLKAAGHNLIKAKDNVQTELTSLNRAVLHSGSFYFIYFILLYYGEKSDFTPVVFSAEPTSTLEFTGHKFIVYRLEIKGLISPYWSRWHHSSLWIRFTVAASSSLFSLIHLSGAFISRPVCIDLDESNTEHVVFFPMYFMTWQWLFLLPPCFTFVPALW